MTDKLFRNIDDAYAIVRHKGVFRQVRVYVRGDTPPRLYVGHGSGFLAVMCNTGTSHPDVSIVEFVFPRTPQVDYDKFGYALLVAH